MRAFRGPTHDVLVPTAGLRELGRSGFQAVVFKVVQTSRAVAPQDTVGLELFVYGT